MAKLTIEKRKNTANLNAAEIELDELRDYDILGQGCFSDCATLRSIEIPKNVYEIEANAFSTCSQLTSITFESGSKLSALGALAFYGCQSLTSISLPTSLSNIDPYAFYYTGMRNVTGLNKTISALFPTEYTQITSIIIPANAVI